MRTKSEQTAACSFRLNGEKAEKLRVFIESHPYRPTVTEVALAAMERFVCTPRPIWHRAGLRYRPLKPKRWRRNSGMEVGYVYLFHAENGLHKIGKSGNPTKRLYQIQQSSPVPVSLVHTIKVNNRSIAERAAHHRYRERHDHHEWFALTPADVADFKSLTMKDLLPPELCRRGLRLSFLDMNRRRIGGKEAK